MKSANDIMLNDFVIRFANVNGSGSASANGMFAKALFSHGNPGIDSKYISLEHRRPAYLV